VLTTIYDRYNTHTSHTTASSNMSRILTIYERYNTQRSHTTASSNKSRILSSLLPETPEISCVLDILMNEQPTSCTITSVQATLDNR